MNKSYAQGKGIFFNGLLTVAFCLGLVCSTASQAAVQTNPLAGTQLAAYYGVHVYDGGYGRNYHRPVHYRGKRHSTYWSNWKYIGRGCERSCLIDNWTGRVIRCQSRC